jgi:hypothetical protein
MKSDRKTLKPHAGSGEAFFCIPARDEAPAKEPSRQKFLEELGEYDQWRDEQTTPRSSG